MIYATRNASEAFLYGKTDDTSWTERFTLAGGFRL
jgi:hypothetical protein